MVYSLIMVIVNRKKLSSDQLITVIFYVCASLLAWVIQIITGNVILIEFVSSIAIFLVYFCLDNPSNYKDREMEILNRAAFHIVLDRYFENKKQFRIVALQTVGIKYLSDTIGVNNRNEFLWQISNKITQIGGKSKVFRISTTRFAIIIEDDDEIQEQTIEGIKMAFDSPFRIQEFKVSLSVRIATMKCPEDADNGDDCIDLIENTLISLTEAEANTVEKVSKSVLEKKRRETQIIKVMRTAIKNEEFFVVYQPIYSIKDEKFTTAEALVRLESKELGTISPEEFIPIAEKNGMILQIGEYVFESVCKFLVKTKIWEKGIQYIHVNLSVIQCMQEKLYQQLTSIMDCYNLDYNFINLEVTETAAAASTETLMNNMNRLIENRMHFSLDDYGTGYSNTSSLVKYPFKTIKIDRTVIWQAVQDEKAMSILRHIIKMIKSLGMSIVAEGIETEEQARLLSDMGCDYIQGFYYSKPISGDELCELLRLEQER